ncbi:hypothetical protein Rrhod_2090 [Rhodococcus rhodnii LMG 5362]|uniref:Secreted protein n=1 Tax=Rhodococcus rhodnii LMG 5362 TaxID=1273125 RepID=R7WMN6_9NOCA|nr:hypothetical protein Rrhod_2090 [Rhodococcus rhodnii LMG 5362]
MSGLLLVVAGAWGALAPFVGPLFDFGFTPREAWTWTTGRGWLEVLPGVVCVLGGLFLLFSRNRVTAMFGGWLAVAAGVWFVIGRQLAQPWGLGDPGEPGGSSPWLRALEDIALFSGLGALIVFLAAGALGRLSVRSVRDIRAAEVRHRTDIE